MVLCPSEAIIIGNETLNAMKANIDYDPPRVKFKDCDQPVLLVETLVHSRIKIHEDPLSSDDRKILQLLNLQAPKLKFSNDNVRNKIKSSSN